jgi:hypothetical protein
MEEAVSFFEKSTKLDPFASLFIGTKNSRPIARREDGKLIRLGVDY